MTLGVSNQGLPDAVTEQTFAAVELKVEQVEEKQLAVTESQVAVEDSEGKFTKHKTFILNTKSIYVYLNSYYSCFKNKIMITSNYLTEPASVYSTNQVILIL